jgi:uncharacterized protein
MRANPLKERESDRDEIVPDLLRPEVYPPPRPRKVTLASTHASWVFLTEREAWKVKRPVDYGFLDFSTPEKRRLCAEEEMRLGARLAPGVYLEVAPIYFGPGGHSFVGPGAIVDHAVRMRRLPDGDSAQDLLALDRLSPVHLARLSARLARFYAEAPLAPEAGAPAVLAANIEENRIQVQPYVGQLVDAGTVEHVCRWQQGILAALEECLHERQAEERVREGHGDLRLEHVYFPSGAPEEPVVIDPIEFNRRFRCQDAALDVAFLAMELEAAGRDDLAMYFLSCFARDANDYGFFPLLDLYLSYRAFVRAKVACIVAADPSTTPDKAARKRAEAARLFGLAASHTAPPPGPQVIAVGGPVGVGKSTLADGLCRHLRTPVISSDATRKQIGGLALTERGGPALYTEAFTRRTYHEMLRRAQLVLDSGRGVILDATFRDPGQRAAARDLAARYACPFLFLEVRCDERTVRRRLRARAAGPSISDAGEDLLDALGRFPPADELPEQERLTVDGRDEPHAVAARVRQQLALPALE